MRKYHKYTLNKIKEHALVVRGVYIVEEIVRQI